VGLVLIYLGYRQATTKAAGGGDETSGRLPDAKSAMVASS